MDPSLTQSVLLWPLAVYFGLVVVIIAGMLGISFVLGQKHTSRSTREPYESGIIATGSARVRFDVKFYQNAIFFVIFDLETMFVIAWALVARQAGWPGYIEILVFIAVLMVTLVYLWRIKALDWRTRREKDPSYRQYPFGTMTSRDEEDQDKSGSHPATLESQQKGS